MCKRRVNAICSAGRDNLWMDAPGWSQAVIFRARKVNKSLIPSRLPAWKSAQSANSCAPVDRAPNQRMDLPLTIALIAGLSALTVFAGWRGARPPDFVRGPRMIPWRPIMVAGAASAMMLMLHLANLLGLVTGR